ncbi:MAG: hypothetical protein ACPGQL_04475 [Thermoplasmatota archaeon]
MSLRWAPPTALILLLAAPMGAVAEPCACPLDDLGEHVWMRPHDDLLGGDNLTVGGVPMLAAWRLHPAADNVTPTVERGDARTVLGLGEDTLTFHDTPTGLVGFRGPGSLLLTLPEGSELTTTSWGAKYVVADRQVVLLSDDLTHDVGSGQVLLRGESSIHQRSVPPAEPAQARPAVEEAIDDQQVAAEVDLADGADAGNGARVYAYDDVQVEVSSLADHLRVQVSAELPTGRAVVIQLPDGLRGQELLLRYFDVYENAAGDGTIETEVVFHEADSLEDALDASNDGGQPEYWVVEDENGLQLIVAFPHWSVHAVTVASLGEALADVPPNVVIGAVVGAAVSVAAAAVLLRPRRPSL